MTPAHPPARFPHLFIVTYGRSGSTLLQGILNAIPGYLIRGENRDVVGTLLQTWLRLPHYGDHLGIRKQVVDKPTEPTNSWYGYEHFRDEVYFRAFRKFLDEILLQDAGQVAPRCYGFKEIRYNINDIEPKMDFLRRLYPGAGFVLNTRRPEDVVKSEFQKDNSLDTIRGLNKKLARLAEQDDCCLVCYEDVLTLSGTLVQMFGFLGETFDEPRLRNVLRVKHGYHTREAGSAQSEHPFFAEVNKHLPGAEFFLLDGIGREEDCIWIGGVLVADPAAVKLRFAHVIDANTQTDCAVKISQNGNSPYFAKKLNKPHAGKARFYIVFRPSGPSAEVRLANGETAIWLRHLDQIEAKARKPIQTAQARETDRIEAVL